MQGDSLEAPHRPPPAVQPGGLQDRFGRRITYLRLSVTDRCNFRCVYCMTERTTFLRRARLLTLEELLEIARGFGALGVSKIRVTGGELLVRRNVLWLLRELAGIPGLRELALTTNGALLEQSVAALRAAGVQTLNISLDTLDPKRFRRLARVGDLTKVLRGIEAARQAGFERIRLNAVILRGTNHDEVADLVDYAAERGLDIAFIEEMPLGRIEGYARAESHHASDEIRHDLGRRFTLLPTPESTGGPARYYRIAGTATRVGFISPHSHNFCNACNRVRVTAEGRLLLCLGQEHSVDLRRVLREAPGDGETLRRTIVAAMAQKPQGHDFDLSLPPTIVRFMNHTGG